MTHRKLLLAIALLSFGVANTSVADEIYKRVDEDGIVEYSDRPSPDADRVEVNPNVVEANPVQRKERTVRDDKAEAKQEAEPEQDDIVADEDPGRATRNAVRALSQPPPRPQPR